MKDFNLTEWVLTHRAFTGFVMVLVLLGGMFAYVQLRQREDPEFTFRVMVVKTMYPGATALEVEQQVTDRLEKKIQELSNLDFLRSYSKPGESVIFVTPREDTPPKDIPDLWYQVRKKVGDIRMALPPPSSNATNASARFNLATDTSAHCNSRRPDATAAAIASSTAIFSANSSFATVSIAAAFTPESPVRFIIGMVAINQTAKILSSS